MEVPSKIFFLVLFTLSFGEPAKDDIEIMKKMMLEMNERVSIAEEKLLKTEENMSAALTDLSNAKIDLATALDELATTNDNLATTNDNLATTKVALMELEKEVSRVKEPPFIHACGSHTGSLHINSQTVPYSALLYSSTNRPGVGGLDTETGVFTAPHPGSYTVTWSTNAWDDAGEALYEWEED